MAGPKVEIVFSKIGHDVADLVKGNWNCAAKLGGGGEQGFLINFFFFLNKKKTYTLKCLQKEKSKFSMTTSQLDNVNGF